MAQLNLLEQAKHGDPQAIARILNQAFQPKGIRAAVTLEGDCLQVVLHSPQSLNVYRASTLVFKALQKLQPQAIYHLTVSGQSTEEQALAWSQTFLLSVPPTTAATAVAQLTAPGSSQQPWVEATNLDYHSTVYDQYLQLRLQPDPDRPLDSLDLNPLSQESPKLVTVAEGTAATPTTPVAIAAPAVSQTEEQVASTTANVPAALHLQQAQLQLGPPGAANQLVKLTGLLLGLLSLGTGLGLMLDLPLVTANFDSLTGGSRMLGGLAWGLMGLILMIAVPLLLKSSAFAQSQEVLTGQCPHCQAPVTVARQSDHQFTCPTCQQGILVEQTYWFSQP